MKVFQIYRRSLVVLAIVAVSIASFEISPAQSKPELISKLLSTYAQYGILNGSVLIAERGKLVFEKGFGFADIEWNVPNEVETKFNLASVTKQFVAMLVLQQVEKGTIKLEDRITDYLPGYPARTGNRITIHQLLNHTSGIPNYTDLPSFDNVISRTPYPSPQAMVRVFSDSALQFDPGTKYSYNNSAYFLLGVILEKVTGKKFDDLLHANILGPLGLKNTGLDDQYALLPKRAMGYNRGVLENNHAGVWDRSSLYTAGGMYSTVEDMYRWEQSLYTDKLLPDRYRSLLFTPSITIDSVTSYGYGWVIKRMPTHIGKDSVTVTYHTGTITGFNALIFRIPERRQTFIFLNNILVGRERLIAMATGCMNILNGAPYEFPRRSLAENLGKVYLQDGIGSAVGKFPEMKRDTVHFELVESEMNDLGYQLLRSHRQKDALEIFKLNSAEFPLSSNAFDSEGEAFLSLGDTTNAAMSYSRSVQLDSTNFNGREILRRLKPR